MKENVLDVLMYLFENYLDDEVDIGENSDTLKTELAEAGFGSSEINKALEWLEGLADLQDNPAAIARLENGATRIFTPREQEQLDVECRSFLLFLEQVGVLDQYSRELVVDRIMALDAEDTDLDTLKWVILMVLFNQPGQEAAYAWIEGLVLNEITALLH